MPDLFAVDTLIFVAIGFIAQLCDGALGMGFGVISYTVLAGMGIPHAVVSASVNGAKIFTGSASGLAHISHKNIDWKLFGLLAVCGSVGGVVGVLVLTRMPSDLMKPVIAAYLIAVGVYIIWRAFRHIPVHVGHKRTAVVGTAGGFLEATAGVWGPLVTSNLIALGASPRYAVGSGNLAETVVALVVSLMLASHIGLENFSKAVLGLLIGAIIASPFAARFARQLPAKTLMVGVGLLVIVTSAYRLAQTFL